MKRLQFSLLISLCVFGYVQDGAAAAAGSPIDLVHAFVYFQKKLLEEQYCALCVHTMPTHTFKSMKQELPEGQKMLETQFKDMHTRLGGAPWYFADIPAAGMTVTDALMHQLGANLLVAMKGASVTLKKPIEKILNDERMFASLIQGVSCAAGYTKLFCIIRNLQYQHQIALKVEQFEEFRVDMQKASESFLASFHGRTPTLKLQDEDPELDKIWRSVQAPSELMIKRCVESKRQEILGQESNCVVL